MHDSDVRSSTPAVSWLLCTNREDALLHRALRSCLSQTMEDFELLLIVNGPSARKITQAVSEAYATDPRVKVIPTPIHFLNFSLSFGLHHTRAPLVARMDADDVSDPCRLETQLTFMKANPRVTVLGSSYMLIDEQEHVLGKVDLPKTDRDIRRSFRFRNPICHPSVMFRRDVVLKEGGYLGGKNAEDYDLWLRIALDKRSLFWNLPEHLVRYNMSPDGVARRSRAAYANVAAAQFRQFLITGDVSWAMGASMSACKMVLNSLRD